jgi:hypothetical protein
LQRHENGQAAGAIENPSAAKFGFSRMIRESSAVSEPG